MADILSLISVAMGGYSIASGYAQGKNLNKILEKIDRLDKSIAAISNDVFLAKRELLVPDYLNKGRIISDIEEIKRAIKDLEGPQSSSIFTGQKKLPKETESAIRDDPWYFLKEVRPLEGASLNKNGYMPIVFEFEGIRFVGWKEESAIENEFSFRLDQKTGLWTPIMFKNIGRNERCPCGSEVRYKHCCGKIA